MSLRFAFQTYRLPLRTALRTAHGPWTEREGIYLRVEAADGRIGFGEVAPIPWFGTETLAEAVEICRKLGDRLTAGALADVPARCSCTRFALSEALRLGPHPSPTGTAPRLPLTALLPAGRAALAVLQGRLEAGWLTFKWKVGVGPLDQETGLLDELLAVLPAYARLRLDANGAWTPKQAALWLARCAERPIEFVEQPVAPADADALLGLARDFPVKLALDESIVRLQEARQWQARDWPGIFVIKPALAGPLDELAAWAAQTKPDVVLSSAIETALGRAAVLRFARRHPELTKRSPGFGVGEVFGDRRWDGPFVGPALDQGWFEGINPGELWNAAS